ncbi:MAG: 2'-5' RNA ligase family protein [Candidatus Paceibacterota bacterium]|jgi:2'-5' RNA ligase
MKFFIGITPPEPIRGKIIAFQKSFPNNKVPEKIEPHITLRPPEELTESEAWLSKIKLATKNFGGFQISLEGIDGFGENVVFLRPAFSQRLVDLHKILLDALGEYENSANKYSDDNQYHPHLTLGGMKWGLTEKEATEMKQRGQRELGDIGGFEVTSIRIYQKNIEHTPWNIWLDVPLNP